MKAPVLLLALVSQPLLAQVTHNLAANDFQFTPDLLTITAGDTVHLFLGAGHGFREVPAEAWELNVSTPILNWDIGPFPNASEHEIVLTTAPDTLYYICTPHADMGMKGRIIINEGGIGMPEDGLSPRTFFPNPTTGPVWLSPPIPEAVRARIIDLSGRVADALISRDGHLEFEGLADGAYQVSVLGANDEVLDQRSLVVQQNAR